jgi:Uma2 family endonuclease
MNQLLTKTDYTPEDLLALPNGDDYELVDGILVERHMGARSSLVGGRIVQFLGSFAGEQPLGWVLSADAAYQCFPNAPNKVRKPDASLIRLGRLQGEELPEGNIRLAPDLAAEVVSPKDGYYEVEQKVEEYLRAGVRLVWVVNPALRKVRIHRADDTVTDVREDGELSGEDVAPGFRCRVSDLFRPPAGVPTQAPAPNGPG